MRSQITGGPPSQGPSNIQRDDASLIEQLTDAIVILDKQGTPCFLNPAARKLLTGSLAARLIAHLRADSTRRAVMQVRFLKDAGGTIVLRISRKRIMWESKRAVMVSLQDITPYIQALEEHRSAFEKQSQELTAECERLRLNLHEREQTAEASKAQLAEAETLAEQLRDEQNRREAAELKHRELTQEATRMKQTLEQLQADRTRLEEAATAHAAEVADLRDALEQQQAEPAESTGDAAESAPSQENIIAAAMRKAWSVRGPNTNTDAWGVPVSE